MTRDDFRQWLETRRAKLPEQTPESRLEHSRPWAAGHGLLSEERFWRRFFSAAPDPSPRQPAWPAVLARIREEESRRASWSDALLLFSRRLAPAFVLIVLLLGGIGLWRDMLPQPQEHVPTAVAMLEGITGQGATPVDEPDAALIAWVGAGSP